jgi:putative cell wall-binding protein
VSCSSGSRLEKEKNSFSDADKKNLETLRERVKIAESLFDLVGCQKKGKIKLNNKDAQQIELAAYLEAEKLEGNFLSELKKQSRKENPSGETIFSQGEVIHSIEADVYSCK